MKLVLALLGILACATCLLALVTIWRAGRNEAAAEAANPPSGAFVQVGDARVHYIDEGEGPVVVLLHGSGGNLNDWTFDMVARLRDRYRVIAFDRPGHGYTEVAGAGVSIADQARLLAEASLALGAEDPIVVGHSFGGSVATAWAVERPDVMAGLVVLAGATNPWDTGISPYYRTLAHPIGGPILANLLAAWVPERVVTEQVNAVFTPQSAPDGYGAHFAPGLTLRRGSLRENALQRVALLPQIEAMVPRYGDIAVPVEIIHGDADATVGLHIHAIPLSQQIPDAALTVLEDVGHMPQHADPGAIVEAIGRVTLRAGLR